MIDIQSLHSLSSNNIQRMLNALKHESDVEPINKDNTPFLFTLPFLTHLNNGERRLELIKVKRQISFSRLFDLYCKAEKEWGKTPSKTFKNTLALSKELGKQWTKSDFSKETFENSFFLLNITIPVIVTGALTVSGWINFYIFTEDSGGLQLGGGWIEHDHLNGTQKLWYFKNSGLELVEDLTKVLSEVFDKELPYFQEQLFQEFKSSKTPTLFEQGYFTELFNHDGVKFLSQ